MYQQYPSPYQAPSDQLIYNPYFNNNNNPKPQMQQIQPQNNQIVQFNPNQVYYQPPLQQQQPLLHNQPLPTPLPFQQQPLAQQPKQIPLLPLPQQQPPRQPQQQSQQPQQQPIKTKETYNPNPQLPLQLKPVIQKKSPFQPQNQQINNNNINQPIQPIQLQQQQPIQQKQPIPLLPLPQPNNNNNNNNPIVKPPPSVTINDIKAKKAPIIINRYLNVPLYQPIQQQQQPIINKPKILENNNNIYEIKYNELSFGKCLGEGAFGRVYEGRWNNSPVALKTLICQLNESIVNDFKSEIKVLSLLRHPNICLFMGACSISPHFVIVNELIRKGSLWNLLHDFNNKNIIDMKLIIKLSLGTAYGMNYLHTKNPPLIHRDLKSANLLVDDSYNIKISDFGLCRVKAYSETMTGNCGTYQWMAPEILRNSYYNEKADVYSYGIVLWELISGECPYNGLDGIQVAIGVLNDKIRPVIPLNCPLDYKELIIRCWSDDVNVRPSFSDIIKILEKMKF